MVERVEYESEWAERGMEVYKCEGWYCDLISSHRYLDSDDITCFPIPAARPNQIVSFWYNGLCFFKKKFDQNGPKKTRGEHG